MPYPTKHVTDFCNINHIQYQRAYRSVYTDGRVRIKLYNVQDVKHASRLLQLEFGSKAVVTVVGYEPGNRPISSIVLVFKGI